jgi:hypothetical protein
MKKLLSCIAVSVCLWTSMASAEVPLPQDVVISAPNSDLKKEIAAFSGKWVGNWSGILDAIFIVEQIGPETAKVIYAWGAAPQWNTSPGSRRYEAKVTPSDTAEITFATPSGVQFTVKMGGDLSTIRVSRSSTRGVDIETFKRVAQ